MATTEFNSFVYTVGEDTLFYYQAIDSDDNPSGYYQVYTSLQDFAGKEEQYIAPREFNDRFINGTAPWRRD